MAEQWQLEKNEIIRQQANGMVKIIHVEILTNTHVNHRKYQIGRLDILDFMDTSVLLMKRHDAAVSASV